ncbi:TPA: hypothetical protein DD617_05125 [Candidatus Uhrbacteria bacterium]|nr:hypothetical protein [Candidatus Uhrbacteria bacterium]
MVEVKQVVPAHTSIILVGKVMIPQSYPESYRLHFKIDGKEVFSPIEKKFFNEVNVGDKVEVDYGFGRLSHSYQPTRIRLVDR